MKILAIRHEYFLRLSTIIFILMSNHSAFSQTSGDPAFREALSACSNEHRHVDSFGNTPYDVENEMRKWFDISNPSGFKQLIENEVSLLPKLESYPLQKAASEFRICMSTQRLRQLGLKSNNGRLLPPPASPPTTQVGAHAQAEAKFQEGMAAYNSGNYNLAIQFYTEAMALDPSNRAKWLVTRGIVHGLNGQPEDALKDYTESINAAPNVATAYYYRSGAYIAAGQTALAYADAKSALQLAPNDAGVQGRARQLGLQVGASTPIPVPNNSTTYETHQQNGAVMDVATSVKLDSPANQCVVLVPVDGTPMVRIRNICSYTIYIPSRSLVLGANMTGSGMYAKKNYPAFRH